MLPVIEEDAEEVRLASEEEYDDLSGGDILVSLSGLESILSRWLFWPEAAVVLGALDKDDDRLDPLVRRSKGVDTDLR